MLTARNIRLACRLACMAAALSVFMTTARAETVDLGQRVVVADGATTEIVYALGQEKHIVGVDTTSLYPPQALRDHPDVGYLRALSAEGILALNPSALVASPGAGPADAVKLIADAGIGVHLVPEATDGAGVVEKIRHVGHLFGVDDRGDALARNVADRFERLQAMRKEIAAPKRVMFILSMQNGRPMVGGRKTAADGMIALAGGTNVGGEFEGYKPMTDEAIVKAAPDVILMMDRGEASAPTDIFAAPALAATPAAAARALIRMEALYLLGFGPRTPDAARELMLRLYPAKASRLGKIAWP